MDIPNRRGTPVRVIGRHQAFHVRQIQWRPPVLRCVAPASLDGPWNPRTRPHDQLDRPHNLALASGADM